MSHFIHGLNPVGPESAVTYGAVHHMTKAWGQRAHEPAMMAADQMKDLTIQDIGTLDFIDQAFHAPCHVYTSFVRTYDAIIGRHYDLLLKGVHHSSRTVAGAKGMLDFLILPLMARQLMSIAFEPTTHPALAAFALMVAGPIEMARVTLGFVLTLLLTPVILLVHYLKPIPQSAAAAITTDPNSEPPGFGDDTSNDGAPPGEGEHSQTSTSRVYTADEIRSSVRPVSSVSQAAADGHPLPPGARTVRQSDRLFQADAAERRRRPVTLPAPQFPTPTRDELIQNSSLNI